MYARFTTVFLRDMACLPELHPNVHAAFMKGTFALCTVKQNKVFADWARPKPKTKC